MEDIFAFDKSKILLDFTGKKVFFGKIVFYCLCLRNLAARFRWCEGKRDTAICISYSVLSTLKVFPSRWSIMDLPPVQQKGAPPPWWGGSAFCCYRLFYDIQVRRIPSILPASPLPAKIAASFQFVQCALHGTSGQAQIAGDPPYPRPTLSLAIHPTLSICTVTTLTTMWTKNLLYFASSAIRRLVVRYLY